MEKRQVKTRMLSKTHRSFAVASATATLLVMAKTTSLFENTEIIPTVTTIAIVIVVAYIAGTLPDIDRFIPFFPHRGVTHAVWVPFGFGYFAWKYQLEPYIFQALLGATIGYTSHIIGDAFSNAGVAFVYPFQQYERLGSGAFYVKGPRGLFQPLYEVGRPSIINPVWAYRLLSVVLMIVLIQTIY